MRKIVVLVTLVIVAGCSTVVATCDGTRDGGIGGTGGCAAQSAE